MIKRSEKEIENKVNELLSKMTIEEKIGQLYQTSYNGSAITGPEFDNSDTLLLIKKGLIGSIIGQYDNKKIYNLQKKAIEESRMKIPLLFCNDIIHGCRIAFPINLAMSASWNPELLYRCMRVVAYEASHSGVHLTFSPMLDLAKDPRWGRVMESCGEDAYLTSVLAASYIKGYHGKGIDSIAACCKHFVGYGACVGGRDYDSVDMSENNLFQNYLPSFKEAIKSNVDMVMTSFNTFNGIPVTMNKYLLKDVLRKKLGFKGVVISDYTSAVECIKHKTANDLEDVAKKCFKAGLDIEMHGGSYLKYLKKLYDEEIISEKEIDYSCSKVLALKYRIGLFDNPYMNIYFDFEKYWLKKENLDVALEMAEEAICLLKNDNVLPLSKNASICFVGPFIKEKRVIGAWGGKAQTEDTISIYEALVDEGYRFEYAKGCDILSGDKEDKIEAINKASKNDIVVIGVGEDQWMSGENNSRANITIPSHQEELIDELIKLGKKVILIVFAGRPLILTKYQNVAGIIYAWFLGTMSGKALVNVLFGKANPSGKITMSFPYDVGQIPVFYNHLPTGRPNIKGQRNDFLTRYLDIPLDPLYHFGYGLSYSNFVYGEVVISSNVITKTSPINVSVIINNDSNVSGKEIVQLYIEACYGSISRPVKELKKFAKIFIPANDFKEVKFVLTYKDLQFYNKKFVNEEGKYRIYVGTSSNIDEFKEVYFKF